MTTSLRGSTDGPADIRGVTSLRSNPPDVEFDDLVAATSRRLHRAALLLTGGDHHLAEDLVQTTYTKVFLAWRRVRRADDPVAYTRAVLTRTYLSHRRLRRSAERPSEAVTTPDDRLGPSAGDPIERVGERLELFEALRTLAPADRAVVVLRYWDDRSVAETADLLGISEPLVRTRSRRALARLRAVLPDLPDDPTDPTDGGTQR